MKLENFVDAIRHNRVRITDHADKEAQAVLITVYRPDPKRWIDWRKRRAKDDAI